MFDVRARHKQHMQQLKLKTFCAFLLLTREFQVTSRFLLLTICYRHKRWGRNNTEVKDKNELIDTELLPFSFQMYQTQHLPRCRLDNKSDYIQIINIYLLIYLHIKSNGSLSLSHTNAHTPRTHVYIHEREDVRGVQFCETQTRNYIMLKHVRNKALLYGRKLCAYTSQNFPRYPGRKFSRLKHQKQCLFSEIKTDSCMLSDM